MLALEEAVSRVLAMVTPLDPERLPPTELAGRFAHRTVTGITALPPFDNSAMDGYAVRAADVPTAGNETPVKLNCLGVIAAGERPPDRTLGQGECWRIFTGAPVPPGADAVVMQEDTRPVAGDESAVEILDPVRPWENIRFQGEDLKAGGTVCQAGERIGPARLALLSAAGVASVEVGRLPRVAVMSTGNELVEPGGRLERGQIYESNRLMIAELVKQAGGTATLGPLVEDDLSATRTALERAFADSDVVVTSGGVSVGEHDHVKAAVESLGGKLNFWRVAIRPGKPFVHGLVEGRHFFGLPGNPVSAFVTFLLLVRPALIRLQGGGQTRLREMQARLLEPVRNPGARRHFVRVTTEATGEVRPAGRQGSHVLSSLAACTGLVDVPAGADLEAGSTVTVLLID